MVFNFQLKLANIRIFSEYIIYNPRDRQHIILLNLLFSNDNLKRNAQSNLATVELIKLWVVKTTFRHFIVYLMLF